MNPSYGILLWIVIGGLAGWIGSKLMGTDSRQGIPLNILFGVLGAVLGGYLTRVFFGNDVQNNGLVVSFLVALGGACTLIFAWKLLSKRRA